jgi:hypothetical protein
MRFIPGPTESFTAPVKAKYCHPESMFVILSETKDLAVNNGILRNHGSE